jgi:hypothetical protein
MIHNDKDKETREERAARRAAEIRAKTAAKEDKTAAKVERDQQRAVLESEARLKLATKRREEAKAKRDESKESTLQTIGDFFTGDILGELGGWNKREAEAQTEYEEALKAISGERSSGAAGAASRRRTKESVKGAAVSGREAAMAKHIGAWRQLSPESQERVMGDIGFKTAEVPTSFRHPDDVAAGESGVHTTETQYTGPKGNVFTMPEKAIRSVIAADRIKGRGKKQERKDAETASIQAMENIAASIKGRQKEESYVQAEETAIAQRENAYNWRKGKEKEEGSSDFVLEQLAAAGSRGQSFEEAFASLTNLNEGDPLGPSPKEQQRAHLRGSQIKEVKDRTSQNNIAYNVGINGGSPEQLASMPWAWEEGGEELKPEIKRMLDEGKSLWSSVGAGALSRQKSAKIRETATWRVGSKEARKDLWIQEGTSLGLEGDAPETLRPKLTPIQVRMPTGWELKDGERVPTEAALDILQAGREEGSLYKVREIGRLTGKNPRITSVADISRQYNAALLRNTSEAQQLLTEAMKANYKGRDAVEDTADAIRATKEGPVRDEALRVLYANEAVIALRDIPKDAKVERSVWKQAMKAHSPPSDNAGKPIGVPLTKAGGEPKWAIVVGTEEDADGNPVPVVYVANNPAATLSDDERLDRDQQRNIKEMEVMQQYKTSFPTTVKGKPYTLTPDKDNPAPSKSVVLKNLGYTQEQIDKAGGSDALLRKLGFPEGQIRRMGKDK